MHWVFYVRALTKGYDTHSSKPKKFILNKKCHMGAEKDQKNSKALYYLNNTQQLIKILRTTLNLLKQTWVFNKNSKIFN